MQKILNITKIFFFSLIAMSLTGCASSRSSVLLEESLADSYWLEIEGIKIHYFDSAPGGSGPGTEDPLLCIHGFSGSGYNFHILSKKLHPMVRTISPDLPGSGFSDKSEGPYSLGYFVEIIKKFKEGLNLGRINLLGHSLGGQIAAAYTHKYPEDINRLVLIAPYGLEGEAGSLTMMFARSDMFIDIATIFHNRLFLHWELRSNNFYDPGAVPPDLEEYLAESLFSQGGVKVLGKISKQVMGTDPVESLLPQIRLPVLLIWGREDEILKHEWSSEFLSLLPDAYLVSISECGHLPMVEKADETAAAILEFLNHL